MVRVDQSTVIDAPIDQVWRILRDFNSHIDWHPAIAQSEMDNSAPSDQVSAVRRFRLTDGAELREQLLSLSDRDYTFRYCLTETALPLKDYVAEVSLKPVTDTEQTYWHWQSSFAAPPGREQELKQLVEEKIYQAGFESLQQYFKHRGAGFDKNPGVVADPERAAAPAMTPDEVSYYSFAQAAPPAAETQRPGEMAAGEIESMAIILSRYGAANELNYLPQQVAAPLPDQVRIKQFAIGVNYIDVYCRTGYFNFVDPPGGIGMEATGEVIDVGTAVTRFKPGDRVGYAAPPVGAYCTIRNLDQQSLVALPDDIPYDMGAAVLLKGMSAEFLLHRVYRLQAGDIILVHAAAGGVGLLLCQWANHLGAEVIGTVSTEAKAALAKANGCHHPIIYTRESFADAALDITQGRGVDAVFDAVGGSSFADSLRVLTECGHLISFGQADAPVGSWDIDSLAAKSVTLSRPNFAHFTNTPEKVSSICERLFAMLSSGQLQVHIGQRYPLADASRAHQALENRATVGSTLLIPPHVPL